MTVTDTFIKDLKIIEPKVFGDQRGYFFETWNKSVFEAAGINFVPVQQNESSSTYGVVRGLHFQLNPYSQAKLVRCVVGKVLDVAVDVRKGSPTFGKHISVSSLFRADLHTDFRYCRTMPCLHISATMPTTRKAKAE